MALGPRTGDGGCSRCCRVPFTLRLKEWRTSTKDQSGPRLYLREEEKSKRSEGSAIVPSIVLSSPAFEKPTHFRRVKRVRRQCQKMHAPRSGFPPHGSSLRLCRRIPKAPRTTGPTGQLRTRKKIVRQEAHVGQNRLSRWQHAESIWLKPTKRCTYKIRFKRL